MIQTILLTGTRAPATLDVGRRLWREGVRVIGADSLRCPLGRFSQAMAAHYRVPPARQAEAAFVEALDAIARRESVDLIWPSCEEIFHISRHREAFGCAVLCPPLEILDALHHKLRFAQWTQSLTTRIRAPASWEGAEAPERDDLIWKPKYSRFGVRTSQKRPAEDLTKWMAQQRIRGEEVSSWALCVEGEVRALTQYRCPVRVGGGAGCVFEPVWFDLVAEFTQAVAAAGNISGSLAFDFIQSAEDGTIFVLECNPRLTSGIHLLDPKVGLVNRLQGGRMSDPAMQKPVQLWLPALLSTGRLPGPAADVMACAGDPWPTLGQVMSLGELAWRALREGISVREASTWDLEYNGDAR